MKEKDVWELNEGLKTAANYSKFDQLWRRKLRRSQASQTPSSQPESAAAAAAAAASSLELESASANVNDGANAGQVQLGSARVRYKPVPQGPDSEPLTGGGDMGKTGRGDMGKTRGDTGKMAGGEVGRIEEFAVQVERVKPDESKDVTTEMAAAAQSRYAPTQTPTHPHVLILFLARMFLRDFCWAHGFKLLADFVLYTNPIWLKYLTLCSPGCTSSVDDQNDLFLF